MYYTYQYFEKPKIRFCHQPLNVIFDVVNTKDIFLLFKEICFALKKENFECHEIRMIELCRIA